MVRALLKGLWEADTWSGRGLLWRGAFTSAALTVLMIVTGATTNGIVGGMTAFIGLFMLAVGAQWRAEQRGTPERERQRREHWADGLLGWPRWKQIGVLAVALAFAATMFVLAIVSAL